jgi:hypothetical protein
LHPPAEPLAEEEIAPKIGQSGFAPGQSRVIRRKWFD